MTPGLCWCLCSGTPPTMGMGWGQIIKQYINLDEDIIIIIFNNIIIIIFNSPLSSPLFYYHYF